MARVRVQVTDRDLGFVSIKKGLEQVGGELSCGIDPKAPRKVILRALVHEYGSPAANIPMRSFLRWAFDTNERKYQAYIDIIVEQAAKGKGVKRMWDKLGKMMVEDVQARIDSNIPPALKEATVKRKGHDLALVDSGEMRRSVTYSLAKRRKAK